MDFNAQRPTMPPITVTIITLNERDNITRAIESVKWADEIIVVDSGSTDGTVEIAQKLGARVVHNPWPGYGKQKNFAQSLATHDWILNVDGDEMVPEDLKQQIQKALAEVAAGKSPYKGFRFPRKNFYLGRWIAHGGWYPNYLVRLAHKKHASWSEPHVHEALVVQGEVGTLDQPLHNYSFPSIQDQVLTNLRFSKLGCEDLRRKGKEASVLKLLLKPIGKFIETYFLKRGFLDGLPGFIISVNAAHSMFLKYAYLCEAKILSEECPERIK
ncbi:MAG: glycosyltransferase family 2 protein [Bdellovibrionia bacterium]